MQISLIPKWLELFRKVLAFARPTPNFTFNFHDFKGLKLMGLSRLDINPFAPNALFLYPLKTENLTVFLCFQGGKERVHWEQMC